jgi:hypothetical protein
LKLPDKTAEEYGMRYLAIIFPSPFMLHAGSVWGYILDTAFFTRNTMGFLDFLG